MNPEPGVLADPLLDHQASDLKLSDGIEVLADCAFKLGIRRETTASAAIYYHKFFSKHSPADYDVNLVAAAALSVAGKAEEDRAAIRDIINVFYSTLNPNAEPLELDGEGMRLLHQSIVALEHLLSRWLSFRVMNDLAHRYVLHYLTSVTDWIQADEVQKVCLSETAWSLVNDFYCNPKSVEHPAPGIAVAAIALSLKAHDLSVRCNNEALQSWSESLCIDMSEERTEEIARDLMLTYRQIGCEL